MSALAALLLFASKPQLAAAIVLHWQPVTGAVAYEVEIADDETFAEPLVHSRSDATTFRWDEVPDRRVYWRARSVDRDGRFGEWSESKEIAPVFVPPELQKPRSQTSFTLDDSVRLEWSASKIFTGYRVDIASDSGFAHVVVDKTVSESHFVFQPSELGNYYWRVRGIDFAARQTAASSARALLVTLAAPELQTVAVHGHTLSLSWRSVRGAQRYRVELDDSTPSTTRNELVLEVARSGNVRVVAERNGKTAASTSKHFTVDNSRNAAAATEPSDFPASEPTAARSSPAWARRFWLGANLALGANLRDIVIFSPGLELGFAVGERRQLGVTAHVGVFYLSETSTPNGINVQTQAWVVPASVLATGALVFGRYRGRLGLGLALNASTASVAVSGAAGVTDTRLSPGAAAELGLDVAFGASALSTELRWSYAPRLGNVRFETGGLVLAIGYAFFL